MNKRELYHKAELLIDKLIPWMLILLFAIIAAEFFFEEFVQAHHLHPWITIADAIVVAVFIADLVFKYRRVKRVDKFIKKYWLEILAVFPFILFFRLFEGVITFFVAEEVLKHSQSIVHETLELEKGGAKVFREAEKAFKISRTRAVTRFIRPLARAPRFLKYLPRLGKYLHFYEKPTKH
ncbi:MAG: hypothetical protein O2779_02010 [Nanoarchaeota archaeon]|nr:hypothetical protein [Nanoarchaeota archaeon]